MSIRAKHSFSRLFVLMVSLMVASCSMEKEAVVAVAPPVVVTLDRAAVEVVELLETLVKKARTDPASAMLRGDLGMAHEVNGFPDAALTSYQQAESLDQNNPRWPYFQSLILADQGEQRLALIAVDRAISLQAEYGPAWMWKGTWLLDAGNPTLALQAFIEAESMGVGAVAIVGQSRVALHQRRPGDAVALLEPLSLEFKHPVVFQLLARAYRESAQIEKAQVALARGRKLQKLQWEDPWHESSQRFEVSFIHRAGHAQQLIQRGESAKAMGILESLREQQPENRVIISNLATAYRDDGDTDRGFWILRRAIESDPDYYPYRTGIADFYRQRGDIETALTHVDYALTLEPELAMLHSKRGLLLNDMGRPEAALKAFQAAIHFDPRKRESFMYAGQVEVALKRWQQAASHYQSAVRVDPSYTPGYLNLAAALAFSDRFDEAQAALEQAEQLGAHPRQVESARSRLATMRGTSN